MKRGGIFRERERERGKRRSLIIKEYYLRRDCQRAGLI